MNTMMAAALLALATMQQPPADTTLQVPQGTRLQLDIRNGDVAVQTWDRSAVRVATTGGRGLADLDLRLTGGAVRIEERAGARARSQLGRIQLTVPAWMNVGIETQNGDVRVRAGTGEVSVSTLRGGIEVSGGSGVVSAESVDGAIVIRDVRGRVRASTVNQGLRVQDVSGDVEVEAVNGGIALQNIDGASVRAETVNGAIQFSGPVRANGFYRMATHNGTVVFAVPARPDAAVTVSTFNGELVSDFPIQLNSIRQKTYNFVLGSGSARIELESFNGTVRLVRSGGGN